MSLAELPAAQKNDMIVSLAALLLEDGGERELHLMSCSYELRYRVTNC